MYGLTFKAFGLESENIVIYNRYVNSGKLQVCENHVVENLSKHSSYKGCLIEVILLHLGCQKQIHLIHTPQKSPFLFVAAKGFSFRGFFQHIINHKVYAQLP